MTEFITRKYGNDGYEIIIKTDSHEHYKASEDFARRLIDHAKPVTNILRIKNMNTEEFARLLYSLVELDNRIPYCINLPECDDLLETEDGIPEHKCIGCFINWLNQPAEEK